MFVYVVVVVVVVDTRALVLGDSTDCSEDSSNREDNNMINQSVVLENKRKTFQDRLQAGIERQFGT